MLFLVILALVSGCIAFGSIDEHIPRADPFAWFVDFVNKTLDPMPESHPFIIHLSNPMPPPETFYGGRGRRFIPTGNNRTLLAGW